MKFKFTLLCVSIFLASFITQAVAQNVAVTGSVKNKATGEPLAGATVIAEKTTTSTLADAKGNFSLSVPKGTTISISFTGFSPLTYRISKETTINALMDEQGKGLDEVVVIGYGSKRRKEISTSISTVGAKEIAKLPVADAAQALQGKVAGVTIVQNSGAPGGTGGTAIRIRGISSLTGTNNPLIVLDGYPLPDQGADNILNSFGTGDIESIDVLKDAAAASIYGVRGANGVVIITTKRGKAGRSGLTVDVYRGIQDAWQLPTMLNAKQYAIINSEANIASGRPIIPKLADPDAVERQYGQGTNWLNEIFRKAAMQSVTLSANGGSDKANYYFTAGYFKQDGIIYKTDVERFNLRFNGDIKVNNRIKVGNSLTMNKFIEYGADTYNPFNSVVLLALTTPPTVSPRNADGSYAGGNGNIDGFSEPNPIYQLEVPKNKFVKYRVSGNIFAEIDIVKSLKFKAIFGGDFGYQENNNFRPATPSSGGRPFLETSYSVGKSFNPDYLAEYTLTYEKNFANKHKVTALGGYTFQENRYSYVNASRAGNFTQQIPVLNGQVFNPTTIAQISNSAEDGVGNRLISYISRLNYDYDNRGFFAISLRRDGSSNFAPKNKFATFASVSAAWRLTQEPFMRNVKWVDDLKVRASFGYTGNPNVLPFTYLQGINQGFQYTFGNSSGSGGLVTGAAPSRSFNPDIKWEKNEQLNVGIDAGIFKGKLNVALDVYQRRSKDLILYVAPPFLSGTYESVPFNTGTLQNRGIDLTLNANVISTKKITWNSSAVVSYYKNKVTSLGLSAPLDGGFARITGGSLRTIQGAPAGFFYGFVTEGIFQNYDEIKAHAVQTAGTDPTTSTAPGDIKFKDINGDGVINDADRTNIGNANPNFTFGFTNTINYKNFELTVFIQGSQGNKVLNFTRWYTEGGVSNGNYSNDIIGRWTGPGTSNSMPRVTLNDPNQNNRVSDRFVEDATYVRLKNIRLAYNIPAKFTQRANLKRTQVYVSSQNLVTLTNYSGLDPEVGGGVDIGFYPQARTFIAGITVDF
ncbi:SusC/RagA family TonB-linked outer membrane protein [Ferruginibacter yonginensis]|uniref:SusC/RagA family TonB-linked outer membrane protein n=1 Tax=Ferruginibacter yonginensis TaxID=1310416 RepID=A0ABV8QV47_9BACT